MLLTIACIVLMIGAVIFGVCVSSARESFRQQIFELQKAKAEAESVVEDLRSERTMRRGRVDNLRHELENLRKERKKRLKALSLRGKAKKNAVDWLRKNGKLNSEGLKRAEDYLQGEGKGMSLGEALVVLKIVSSEDMNLAATSIAQNSDQGGDA